MCVECEQAPIAQCSRKKQQPAMEGDAVDLFLLELEPREETTKTNRIKTSTMEFHLPAFFQCIGKCKNKVHCKCSLCGGAISRQLDCLNFCSGKSYPHCSSCGGDVVPLEMSHLFEVADQKRENHLSIRREYQKRRDIYNALCNILEKKNVCLDQFKNDDFVDIEEEGDYNDDFGCALTNDGDFVRDPEFFFSLHRRESYVKAIKNYIELDELVKEMTEKCVNETLALNAMLKVNKDDEKNMCKRKCKREGGARVGKKQKM